MKAAPERAWIVPRERVGQRGGFRVDGGHRKRRSPQASSPLGGRLVACGPAPATPRAFDDAGRNGCCTAGSRGLVSSALRLGAARLYASAEGDAATGAYRPVGYLPPRCSLGAIASCGRRRRRLAAR